MKNIFLTTVVFSVLLSAATVSGDPNSFPSNGLDAQSLGRGGAVIACPPGVWSTFGNPATLTPAGFWRLGIEYLDQRGASESSLGLSIVDTTLSIRGSLSYFADPEFAGFKNNMWGISLSQTLKPSLYLGESFHMGDYEPESTPGDEKNINNVDAGLLYKVGPKISIGYVAHNLFTDDRDLLEQYNGFGVGLMLPWTIYFAADYEEDPDQNSERNFRTGIEFEPVEKLTGRVGYQDLANGITYMTMGITYTDINGTVDAAILYNNDTDSTDRIALGLSLRM